MSNRVYDAVVAVCVTCAFLLPLCIGVLIGLATSGGLK